MGAINLTSQLQWSCVETEFNARQNNTLAITMARTAANRTQSFSLSLLNELRSLLQGLQNNASTWIYNGSKHPVHYVVLKSAHPDYFSLGGDLAYFRECIRQHDKNALREYSTLCLNMVYEFSTILSQHATTVALVRGRALGGGFETALSADFIVAEEQSEFGFPEILFGLFPCTGGMSLLAKRVGVHEAERMMTNGKIYSSVELKEMGVVDEIYPVGQGEIAVEKFVANHARHRQARLLVQRARHRMTALNYDEMLNVVDEWVEAAVGLGADDLRVMDMLIQMQRSSIAA